MSNATECSSPVLPSGSLERKVPRISWRKTTTTKNETIPPTGRRKKERYILVTWWWWWELGAALLSTACVCVITIVLSIMDDKPLSHWRLSISPNAVVSVLTTVAKSALLLQVAECISQLKWLHFDRSYSLSDLQVFDYASRGPWGAFVFLWNCKGTALTASLGCLIILASLGFEPTAQQVLDFPVKTVEAGNETGSIGITSQFDFIRSSSQSGDHLQFQSRLLSLRRSIFSGLIGHVPDGDYHCTTSECHFGDITSLEICGRCEDHTAHIWWNCTLQNSSFEPSGVWLCSFENDRGLSLEPMEFFNEMYAVNETAMSVNVGFGGGQQQFNYMRANFTVFNMTSQHNYLKLSEKGENDAQFCQCSWNWCTRTYSNFSIVNGATESSAITEEALHFDRVDDRGSTYIFIDQKSTPAKEYTVNRIADESMFSYLTSLLNNSLRSNVGLGGRVDPVLQMLYQQDATNVTKSIALALSNKIREPKTNPFAREFKGTAMRQETFVHVRWAWLILPICLTTLGLMLLIVSIVMSDRTEVPLLKSSALALLFHGAEGFSKEERKPPGFEDSSLLSDKAVNMKVKLRQNADGVLKFKKTN